MGIVKRESFWITIFSYIGVTIGYLNKLILLPNFFKTDEVGLINVLVNIAVLYAQFSSLGTNNIILRFFPFFKNDQKKHHGFLFRILVISLIGFIIITVLFILFKEPVSTYYSKRSPLLVDYYFYIIPLGMAVLIYFIFDNYLRSLLKTVFSTFVYEVLLRILTTLAVTAYLLHFISFKHFVVLYVIIYFVISFTLVIYTYVIGHLFLLPSPTPLFRRLRKNITNYAFYGQLSNISNAIISNIDSLMVAGMLGLAKTGIYITITYITGVLLVPYRAIMKISSPIVAYHWKKKDMAGLNDLYRKVTLNNLLIGSFLFAGIWINMDNIFKLIPKDYAEGKYVFLFLGLGKLFDMVTGLNGTILVTSKKYRYDMLFSVMLIVLIAVSNYILIPIYGIKGAAIASMITLFIYHSFRVGFIYFAFKIHPFSPNCLWIVGITAIATIITQQFHYFGNFYSDVFFRTLIYSSLFLTPVYFLNLSPDINSTIKSFFSKFKWFKKNQ